MITGHTGFKGSWMSEWLLSLGAEVHGFALQPPTEPSLFDQLNLADRMTSKLADVRDRAALGQVLNDARPQFVFHMAAQPLVRRSYREPHDTFTTNFVGTLNLLEELRLSAIPCVVVTVTSDKCYEAALSGEPLSESSPLGGRDCYSASKGAVELLVSSYRRSFFMNEGSLVKLATARAGNVIGGGDWSGDRIIPDCVRSLGAERTVAVRNPSATRPWQHVLEPLSGYLLLASRLADGSLDSELRSETADAAAFNFGPADESERSVQEVVEEVLKVWPGAWSREEHMQAPHESARLSLSSLKARELLGWRPVWTFPEAIRHTVKWYAETCAEATRAPAMTRQQIVEYQRSLGER